jgi:hypothetical protein
MWILALCACSRPLPAPDDQVEIPQLVGRHLFHAETAIQDEWLHMPLRGTTDYRLAVFEDQLAIRAVGRNSASGLIRRISVDPLQCREIEWSWAVTDLQTDAILTLKEREDVAASIFLMFGDPGSVLAPEPVPTLRYVWTNETAEPGAIIDNPYFPGTIRSIVTDRGLSPDPSWVLRRRDIVRDFQDTFGRPPDDKIHAIVLFTDNDQTKQPVEAYYGWAQIYCAAGAGPSDSEQDWD